MEVTPRKPFFAIGLIIAVLSCAAGAPAAVEMSTGIRYVIPSGSTADCGTKAKAALDAYLTGAAESSPGSGDWLATGPIGASSVPTASAVVRCADAGKGYVVTFTCVVQLPENPYNATALCLDVAHKFSGKPVTPLATPAPIPTGCTAANLIGTWQSSDKSGPTLTMDVKGNLTDQEGVSGNWILYGNNATLTYYGNHSVTLSPDGKHLRGSGYDLTRKC